MYIIGGNMNMIGSIGIAGMSGGKASVSPSKVSDSLSNDKTSSVGKGWFSKLREMFSSFSFKISGFSLMSLFGQRVEITEDPDTVRVGKIFDSSLSCIRADDKPYVDTEMLLNEIVLQDEDGGNSFDINELQDVPLD